MQLAIRCAMNQSPSIDELIANLHKIVHERYDPATGALQCERLSGILMGDL